MHIFNFLLLISYTNAGTLQPEDMITIEINPRAEENFFTHIETVPNNIWGYWVLSASGQNSIDFTITSPTNEIIFEKHSAGESVFNIDVERIGVYTFSFKNTKVLATYSITIACSSGNLTSRVLTSDHLTPIENDLEFANQALKEFQVDSQFTLLRQEAHYKTAVESNKYMFWFTLVESLGIIIVTAWQVYYIKKLLDNRRVF